LLTGGGGVTGFTLIWTVSVSLKPPESVTVNANVSAAAAFVDTDGAVNVGVDEAGLLNVTEGPSVCLHAYVSEFEFPSGS
jgi:hypothetical protein